MLNNWSGCSTAIVCLLLHCSVHPRSIVTYSTHNHKTHSWFKVLSFPKTALNPRKISTCRTVQFLATDILGSFLSFWPSAASHFLFNIFPWICLFPQSLSVGWHCPAKPACWYTLRVPSYYVKKTWGVVCGSPKFGKGLLSAP